MAALVNRNVANVSVAALVNRNVANVAEKEAVGGDQSTTPLQCVVFDQLLQDCAGAARYLVHCS